MILEGIVATSNHDGSAHVAAMGPEVNPAITQLTLKPFQTSQTFANLAAHRSGVVHTTDDVELLVQAALQQWPVPPAVNRATAIDGFVLTDCCRWFEFEVERLDTSADRARVDCRIVHSGECRPFFGFNRAKHAVLEAAILATRVQLIPRDEIFAQLDRLQPWVEKTAGDAERRAWNHVAQFISGAACDDAPSTADRWAVSP